MEKEEVKQEDNSKEEEPKELDMIEKAKLAAADLKAQNDRREELISRQERLMAEQKLGGVTNAGTSEEKKEETPKEYKDRVMRGELN